MPPAPVSGSGARSGGAGVRPAAVVPTAASERCQRCHRQAPCFLFHHSRHCYGFRKRGGPPTLPKIPLPCASVPLLPSPPDHPPPLPLSPARHHTHTARCCRHDSPDKALTSPGPDMPPTPLSSRRLRPGEASGKASRAASQSSQVSTSRAIRPGSPRSLVAPAAKGRQARPLPHQRRRWGRQAAACLARRPRHRGLDASPEKRKRCCL